MREIGGIYVGDGPKLMVGGIEAMTYAGLAPVVVTDPPFNVGYHHNGYSDRMDEGDCHAMPAEVTAQTAAVVIHYPEQLHRLSIEKGEAPERVVSRVYNPNTRKRHRDAALYGVKPDFDRVKQPYRNQNGRRIRKPMAEGRGARLYGRRNVNQVKNVPKAKTGHPRQMPVEVMGNIIGILPDGIGAIDPFPGSGTTAVACAEPGVPFIGYGIVEGYADIAIERVKEMQQ